MALKLSGSVFLTNGEAAETAGVTRQTLWRWRADGRIPLGRQYRGRVVLFTEAEVAEIVRYANRIEPLAPAPRGRQTQIRRTAAGTPK